MTTLTGLPTLLDAAKNLAPDGTQAHVAEILTQQNEMLIDMPWQEGNLPTGHRITTRTGLPDVYWRRLNRGVPTSKATTAQVDETCGLLEARSEVDLKIANLNGNSAGWRLNQSTAFLEAMNQRMQYQVLNGDLAGAPESFIGLAPRFSQLESSTSAASAENVIDAGGTGSNLTSIWLIGWSPRTVYGIYPKGSVAGLDHRDLGEIDATDINGYKFRALADMYTWDCGIAVEDWRYVVRIANIDVDALVKDAKAGADLNDLLVRAAERLQSTTGVNPVFYCNRTIRSFLRRQTIKAVSNSTLTYDSVGGSPILRFSEFPVRMVDGMKNNEARVV